MTRKNPRMKKLYKKFLLRFMQTKLYEKLLLDVIPYIRFTTYYTLFRGWKYYRGYQLLKPGHFMVTIDEKKLTSKLIGGDFSHATFCVAKDVEWEISEMTHTNYTRSNFFDICKESTRVVILKCDDWDEEYTKKVIERIISPEFQKALYDKGFEFGIKALYCSEMVYLGDFEKRLKVNLDDIASLGRQYISPQGLYNGKNVTVVWDSDSEVI